MKPLLFHIQPLRLSDNTRIDIYVGDAPSAEAYGLGGFVWEPAVAARPVFTIELMSPAMDGSVMAGRATFSLQLRNITQVPSPDLLSWQGAPIWIYGAPDYSWSKRGTEFNGIIDVARFDIDSMVMALDAKVSTALIERPLFVNQFGGGGGLDGEAAVRGKFLPAGFGACENIEPVWFDTVNNIGMIDGYANCLSITRLMEGASDMGARVADYATYALLQAAIAAGTVGPGQWATSVSQGLIGLGAPQHGTIGVNATFGGGKPGTFIKRLLNIHAGVTDALIDTASLTALTTQVEAAAGVSADVHWWTKEQNQVNDIIQAVAASCNATPLMTFQGLFSITRAVSSAPVATLDRRGSVEPRVINWKHADPSPPFYKLRARVARPANVLTRDQVNFVDTFVAMGIYDATKVYRAGNTVFKAADGSEWLFTDTTAAAGRALPATAVSPAALASNAYWQQLSRGPAYADGTLIEALKPAESGANKTETHTASAIAGQGLLATANNAALGSSGQVVQQDGVTHVTDATAITSIGTAAAIAGQGTLATANAADYASQVTGTGKPDSFASPDNNLVANPDVLLDTSGWALAGGLVRNVSAIATDPSRTFIRATNTVGNASVRSGAQIPVPPGATLYFSGKVRSDSVLNPLTQVITTYGSDTTTVVANAGGATVSPSAPNTWTDFKFKFTVPATAAFATIAFRLTSNNAGAGYMDLAKPRISTTELGSDVTSSNTAAAIASQGSLATKNAVDLATSDVLNKTASNIVYLATGTTVASKEPAEAGANVTSTHTAAAIAGQGAFATVSSAAYGSSFLTGFGTLAARANVRLNNEVYRSDGTTLATDATLVTSLGTASAIAGQGALATLGYVTAGSTIRAADGVTVLGDVDLRNLATPYAVRVGASAPMVYEFDSGTQGFAAVTNCNVAAAGGILTVTATAADPQISVTLNSVMTSWPKVRIKCRSKTAAATWDGTLFWSNAGHALSGAYYKTASPPPGWYAGDWCIAEWDFAGVTSYGSNTADFLNPGVSVLRIDLAAGQTNVEVDWVAFGDFAGSSVLVNGVQDRATWGATHSANTFRDDGVTLVTDAAAITSLGTAAAISGQGALATSSSVAWGSGGRVYRDDGVTRVTDTVAVTSLGTAAAIAGQGAFATVSSAAYGSSLLTGFGALAARANVRLGTEVVRADGTTSATDAMLVTSLGTASAIASQGSYATLSQTYFGDGLLKETSGGATATLAIFKTSLGTAAAISGQGTGATASNLAGLNATEGAKFGAMAPNADAAVKLFTLGPAAVTRQGNTLTNTSGADSYGASLVGAPIPGGAGYAWTDIVAGANSTIAVLDDENTTYDYLTQLIYGFYKASDGTWALYSNGVVQASGTITANLTGRLEVRCDRVNAEVWVAGGKRGSFALSPTGPLYAKFYAYTAGSTTTGFGYGPADDLSRQQKLNTTGVATDSTLLPANTLYGLIPSLKAAVTISDTDNTGTVTLNIGSAVYYPDTGATITFPSGTLAGKAYGTTYFIKRTGVDPVTAPTGTGWNASTALTIAVGDVYVNSFTTRANGATPSPPPPPPPGGGFGGGGGGGVYIP